MRRTGVVVGWLELDAVVSAHSGPALDPEVETETEEGGTVRWWW